MKTARFSDRELRARVIRVVRETGPRKRRVLDSLSYGDRATVDHLLAAGRLVTIGSKRGTKYGTPAQKKASR